MQIRFYRLFCGIETLANGDALRRSQIQTVAEYVHI